MFSDRVFQIALLLSLITHGVILFQNSNFNPFFVHKKEQILEVSYIKPPPEEKTELTPQRLAQKDPFLKLTPKITLERRIPPAFIDKEIIFKDKKNIAPQDATFIKPAFIKPDIIAIKKKIILPPIDIDKINNPSYISYYQIVREKIKRAAYQNYTRNEIGQTYLSFIISSNGSLKEVRLVGEKSSPIPYLREIALRSINDASPFPVFPKELDYAHLSFNVIISFEME